MARRPKPDDSPRRRVLRLIPRHGAFPIALIAGLVGFGGALLAQQSPLIAITIGANVMFVAYLAIVALEVPELTPQFLRKHADDENFPVWMIFLVTFAIVALCAYSLFKTLNSTDDTPMVVIIASIVSVLLGWFVIHTMAGFHYAYEYYESPTASPGKAKTGSIVGGFEWPKGEEPNGVAFLYVAYQIGSAMQIADVATTSNKMRALVASHIVFSFLYNTLILAAAVNVVVSVGNAGSQPAAQLVTAALGGG
jgi:uncharacterized membrane protein